MRPDRRQLLMIVVTRKELTQRRDLADLRTVGVELERAIQRLEISRQREYRLAQLELVKAFRGS